MKSNPAQKNSEQCFFGKTKPTCQNSATFEHFQKWPKNQGDVLAHGPSNNLVAVPTTLRVDSDCKLPTTFKTNSQHWGPIAVRAEFKELLVYADNQERITTWKK